MAKLYKYNGAWETYQYLHDDVGFNTESTNSVSFKSTGYGHKSWGDSDGSGYALDTNDSTDIEYFRSGSHGWYDLNALASSLHVYPANATDCQMTNGTVTSDAVMLTFSDSTLVLISLGKSYGWKTIEEWAERGWTLNSLPIVHSYTGVQTAKSIKSDTSFDTGLEWSSSNLYIGETNDGHGNVTRYGWECIARVPYYAIGGVIDSTSEQNIMVHVSYETFGVLEQDS